MQMSTSTANHNSNHAVEAAEAEGEEGKVKTPLLKVIDSSRKPKRPEANFFVGFRLNDETVRGLCIRAMHRGGEVTCGACL